MKSSNKKSYSNFHLMQRSLEERGYVVTLLPLSPQYVCFTAPSGWRWLTKWAALSYPFMSVACKQISKDKKLAYEFASHFDVTTPATLVAPTESTELDVFLQKHKTVIVKPADSSGSHGLTLNITDRNQLDHAIIRAQEFSPSVLVQQQVSGPELRFTIIEGEIVSVLHRKSPCVEGDGVSTIAQLIAAENVARQSLQFEYLPYPQLDATNVPLELLQSNAVAARGAAVILNTSSMVSKGASVYDVADQVHESYKQTVQKLARELNNDFLIIDMMIQDFTAPQSVDNYAFIEFNTAPALRLYYGIRDGQPYDIVEKLTSMIDRRSKK